MPVKIRLTRQGKKKYPYYHIVVTDSRAPRDGKYIERIGAYNPNVNPAMVELNFDKALDWLQKGAQPTDTCKTLLSSKGVLYKNHLLNGVKKNALTLDQVEAKFSSWLQEKESKVSATADSLVQSKQAEAKKRLEAENKKRAAKAQAIAAKNAEAAAEPVAEASEPVAETISEPVAEVNNETAAETATEETAAE